MEGRGAHILPPIVRELEEILATIVESGHSRFPVIGADRDEGLGILLAKDLLPVADNLRRAIDSVAPELVEMSHPLAGGSGATNAATIATEALGEVTVVGPGAGRRETGYALLNDLITIAGRTRP